MGHVDASRVMRHAFVVRYVAVALLVLVTAGCGGSGKTAAKSEDRGRCIAAAAATDYLLCGQPTGHAMAPPSTIVRGDKVIAKAIAPVGHWRSLFLSPDGKTLLVEWSGECEIPTAYFVPADGGKPRPLTNYAKASATSFALGWQGGKARVRLPVGEWPDRKPGVYLVDPATMAKTLIRRLSMAHGC